MKHGNRTIHKKIQWVVYTSIAFTALSVIAMAIMSDRFTILGDPYHHTLVYAPYRALLPWLGILLTVVFTFVYHYVALHDKK